MQQSQKLDTATVQTQTLTPLQVQYVRLLELNTPAIEDEVRRRLDENPALEAEDDDTAANADTDRRRDDSAYDSRDDKWLPGDSGTTRNPLPERTFDAGAFAETLAQDLKRQLAEADIGNAATRTYAEYIADTLDANGRMTRTLAEIADDISTSTGLEVSRADLKPAFEAIRALDPAGVGATDLRDCLLLQLRRRPDNPDNRLATRIVDTHFDTFTDREFDRLANRLRTDRDAVDRAVAIIKSLNPKPGGSSAGQWRSDDPTQHIAPDFSVETDATADGTSRFTVSLTQRIPRLALSQTFSPGQFEIKGRSREHDAARAFLRTRAREATDFIDMIERRGKTLLQVMTAIVDMQPRFFATGDTADLRPMVLRDIAEKTGLHQSVVSRATNGKYVATPTGVFSLKTLFNAAPADDPGLSTPAIMDALHRLVDGEDKRHPLSDDALTAAIKAQGIDIARRTVAKYREMMQIPNSRARRTEK